MTVLTSPLRAISERTGSLGHDLNHDIEAVALRFGAAQGQSVADIANLGTATVSAITFRRVDPLHEPLKVADERLQSRLEELCETLRAKY
jgi:hypothetical protein